MMTFEDIVSSSIIMTLSFQCQASADSYNILFVYFQRIESERVVLTFQILFNKRAFISTLFLSTKEE